VKKNAYPVTAGVIGLCFHDFTLVPAEVKGRKWPWPDLSRNNNLKRKLYSWPIAATYFDNITVGWT